MPSISIYGDGIAYGNYPLDDHVSWARMSPTPCAAIQAAASGKFTTTDLTKPGIRYESYVTGVAPDGTEAIPGKGVGTTLATALKTDPSAYIAIRAGINDVPATGIPSTAFITNVITVVDAIVAKGKTPILIGISGFSTYAMTVWNGWATDDANVAALGAKAQAYNEILRTIARQKNNLLFVDIKVTASGALACGFSANTQASTKDGYTPQPAYAATCSAGIARQIKSRYFP